MIDFVLDKIQLRNVRCYGDEVMEMDFPLNNLTVFTGRVGAGKSTILKAVSMALYGEDGGAKGEKLAIDDMLNEKNKKNLEIHLYFHSSVDNSNDITKYEIHLFHKHSKYNNKLVFVKDGKDISLESKTATYELIEKTLIPKNVYHNVYYFTQQCKNFFTALPNTEQKEIFNSILDLSEYSNYYDNCRQCLTDAENELEKLRVKIEADVQSLKSFEELLNGQKEQLEKEKQSDNQRIDELELLICDLKNKRDEIMSESEQDLDEIKNLIHELQLECQRKISEYESHIKLQEQAKKDVQNNFDTVYKENLKNKYINIRMERSKDLDTSNNELEVQKSKYQNEVDNIESKYNAETYKRSTELKNEYQKKLNELNDKLNSLIQSKKDLDTKRTLELGNECNNTKEQINKIKTEIKDKETEVSVIDSKIKNVFDSKSDAQREIEQYKFDLTSPTAVCRLCGQPLTNKDHVQKHIDSLEEKIKEYDSTLNNFDKTKNECLKMISSMNDNIKNIAESYNQYRTDYENKYTVQIGNIENEIKNLNNEKENLTSTYNGNTEALKKEFLDLLCSSTRELNDSIKKCQDQINENNSKKEKITEDLREEYKVEWNTKKKSVEEQILGIDNLICDFRKTIEEITNDYDVRIGKLRSEQTRLEQNFEEIKQYESEISKCEYSLSEIKSNTHDGIINDINNTNRLMKDKSSIIEVDKKKYIVLNKKKNILEFWKTAFSDSGIKSMLIDSAIPHMNECVMDELTRVAPGKFTVSFDTLSETKSGKIKDKFNINIVNNEKGSTGHKKLSGGEKRIIDLCCMSALRSLAEKLYGKRFHHIFYDEILDSLDDECKQAFCINVKLQSQSGCNVTLVTHDLPEDVDPDRTFPF